MEATMLFLGGEVDGQEIEIPDDYIWCPILISSPTPEYQTYKRKQIVFDGKIHTVMACGSDEDILRSFNSWYQCGDRQTTN